MTPTPFYTLTAGDLTVTVVNDGQMSVPLPLLSGITPEGAKCLQRNAGLASPEAITTDAYLIRGRGRTVLVDAGIRGINGVSGAPIVNLTPLDVRPEKIDTILLTHAHPGHVGRLLTAAGTPAYPNATVFLSSWERAYWLVAPILDNASDRARRNVLLVHRVPAICTAQICEVDGEETVVGIHLYPLPDHMPDHAGYRLEAGDTSLLVWGDIVHLPIIQTTRPPVSVAFDVDPEQARQARERLLCQIIGEQWLIAGVHLGLPGFAGAVETPSGYLLQSV